MIPSYENQYGEKFKMNNYDVEFSGVLGFWSNIRTCIKSDRSYEVQYTDNGENMKLKIPGSSLMEELIDLGLINLNSQITIKGPLFFPLIIHDETKKLGRKND